MQSVSAALLIQARRSAFPKLIFELQFRVYNIIIEMRQQRQHNQPASNKNNLELQSVSPKEWAAKVRDEEPDSIKMHVYHFLITEGHFDIAHTFAQEAAISKSKIEQMNGIADKQTSSYRLEIKNLIRTNKIDEAIQKLKHFKGIPKGQGLQQIIFDLLCLKVVNFIKEGQIQAAISTAQQELIRLVQLQPSRMETLEKVMSIIAFVNIQQAKNNHLAMNNHKLKLADQVNTFLLGDNNSESIKNILSVGKWLEKRLDMYLHFPHIHPLSQQLFQQ